MNHDKATMTADPHCAGIHFRAKESCHPRNNDASSRLFFPALVEETVIVPMTEYRLVVGVHGIIFDEDAEAEAKHQFDLFVKKSKNPQSAEAGSSVTLFRNHEIIQEYHPAEPLGAANGHSD
jgi:hypothetical protein